MSDTYKLQYDGMTLTYPGWNGYMSYASAPSFHTLTLYASEGGTVTASVLTGVPGDTITLTTTHDNYYRLSGYDITGNGTIEGNTFTFGTEDTTANAQFKLNTFTATGSIAWGNNLNGQGQGAREARPTLHINAYTGNDQSDIEVSTQNYANYGHTGSSTAASKTTANRGWKYSTVTSTCVSFPSGTSAVSLHVKGTYTGNHAGQAAAYVAADQRRATLYVLGQSTIWDSFFPKTTNGNASKAFDITKTSATVNDTNQYIYFRIYNANDSTGTPYNCGNRWAYNRAVGLTGTFTATGILK